MLADTRHGRIFATAEEIEKLKQELPAIEIEVHYDLSSTQVYEATQFQQNLIQAGMDWVQALKTNSEEYFPAMTELLRKRLHGLAEGKYES